jgi:PIN domain nuclease of toxin-antitoxin system
MQLLLDTHTLIWFFESDARLSKTAKTLITDRDNQNFFSVASIWEMAIKHSIGKLELTKSVAEIVEHIQNQGIELIEVTAEHALKVGELDFFHKDPFDRLIIAQSLILNYSVVSKDEIFDSYTDKRLW